MMEMLFRGGFRRLLPFLSALLAIGMTMGTLWCLLDLLKGGTFRDKPLQ